MNIEDFEKLELMLEIREKLLEAQIQKASGVPMLDFEDAMKELEDIATRRLE